MKADLSSIICGHGKEYLEKSNNRILPSHKKALYDLAYCRTDAFGGEVYFCKSCNKKHYSFHSCGNRHCPKCQNYSADEWIEKQTERLLPVNYFLVTFTLPFELRSFAYNNQKLVYSLLMKTAFKSLQDTLKKPKYLGAQIGALGVLHTCTRDLRYHPHVHFLIPGGGLSFNNNKWVKLPNSSFLFNEKALGKVFKAKFQHEIEKKDLKKFTSVAAAWCKPWIVNCKSAGRGETVLKYLAQYIYRIAISNNRIISLKDGMVTFKYKENESKQFKFKTISAVDFLSLFMKHILPKNFQKVRSYGFLAGASKEKFKKIKILLKVIKKDKKKIKEKKELLCPNCQNKLFFTGEVLRKRRPP